MVSTARPAGKRPPALAQGPCNPSALWPRKSGGPSVYFKQNNNRFFSSSWRCNLRHKTTPPGPLPLSPENTVCYDPIALAPYVNHDERHFITEIFEWFSLFSEFVTTILFSSQGIYQNLFSQTLPDTLTPSHHSLTSAESFHEIAFR